MTEDTVSAQTASKPVRRRASRAAGPAAGTAASATDVSVEAPKPAKPRISRPAPPPPGRQPPRTLVTWVSLASVFAAVAVTGLFPWLAFDSTRHMEAAADRQQRFVDTATQAVVNMFSYNQDSIDESVNRFVNGTS